MAGIILNRSRQVPAEDTPAFGGIAERFRRAGDLDRAIALCREGLQKFPNQLSARVTLGWSLLDQGKYDEARAELERVLRRAPDNLAAIRGLAELHDRSEGAMPSMDESESWRHEEEAAEAAAASPVPTVAANPTGESGDPFAPISVTLASATAQPSPEILHTADDAQQSANAAAAAEAVEALLGPERVEIENPAAAAMAAAAPVATVTVPEPSDAALLGDDESLEDAVAGLGIEVSVFDPGVTASPASVTTFSPFDASVDAAPADLQIDSAMTAAQAMFEVESSADLAVAAAAWAGAPAAAEPSSEIRLDGAEEFSDAADLMAALKATETASVGDASSLVLEAASGEEGLLDAELAAFEEPQGAVELKPQATAHETLDRDADLVADVVTIDEMAAEPARDLVAPADTFDPAGMKTVDTVVSARAYDVSAPPPEDFSQALLEAPAELLDDERVVEAGRFEMPDSSSDEPSVVVIQDAEPVLAAASNAPQAELAEAAFVLTSPEAIEVSEAAVDDVDTVAAYGAALALPESAAAEGTPALDFEKADEPLAVVAAPDADLHSQVAEVAEQAASRVPELVEAAYEVAPVVEPIADTVSAAFQGLPEPAAEPIEDQSDAVSAPDFSPELNYALEVAAPVAPVESGPELATATSPFAALLGAAVETQVSAEVVRMTTHLHTKKTAVAALERFLRQVERRRVQLESGSVA